MKLKITSLFISLMFVLTLGGQFASAQTNEELLREIESIKTRLRAVEDYIISIKPAFDEFNENSTKTFSKFFDHTQNSLNQYTKQLHDHINNRMQGMDSRKVVLDPVNRGFQKITTPSGDFLISIKSFKPIFGASGYRLIFNIGNPNYASYSGINLALSWGEKYNEKSLKSHNDWKKSLKQGSFKYNGRLSPGAWTEVGVEIMAQSTQELQHIECALVLDTVELNLRNPQIE